MGCSSQKDQKDTQTKEAEKYVQQYIKDNYLNVNTITFTEHETNPMGILMIRGYLNDNKDKIFSVHYDPDQKDISGAAVNAEEK